MPKLQIKRREEIFRDIINAAVARTDLSDVTDSSTVKHFAGAVASAVAEVYFEFTRLAALFDFKQAAGDDLDERAKEIFGGTIGRLGPRRAVGKLKFDRQVASGSPVTIPLGTGAKTTAGITVESTETVTIVAAGTSIEAAATAKDVGIAGNIASGTAVIFVSKPAGVDTVTNSAAFTGGRDRESNDDFRERLLGIVRSLPRSTLQALEFTVLGIADPGGSGKTVRFSHLFEDPNVPGTAVLYVDDGAGTARTSAAVVGQSGTGGSLSAPDGTNTVTFTNASGAFTAPMVGTVFVLSGAVTAANNGHFTITAVPSATTLKFVNAAGALETLPGAAAWSTGELVTSALAGPPAGTAVGGEEFLDLGDKPVAETALLTLIRHRGTGSTTLVLGTDFDLRASNGRLFFRTPLLNGDRIIARYTFFTALIREVQKVVDGDVNDRVKYPGHRAAGVDVRVFDPVIRQQAVVGTLTVAAGFTRTTVATSAKQAVNRSINSLGISGDVVRNEIIEQIMLVPGVVDVDLTNPPCTIARIVMLDNELPRIADADIAIS